jgi:hypothetical protein
VRRIALFLAGVITGVIAVYIAAVAAVWRHLTHQRRVP